ncbi:retrovirus-related pol polyprotein from transposon TNT 1-94 [Tanacetum coccineum]
MSRDLHVAHNVLDNSKNAKKNVAVYVRKNKQEDVILNKENVIDVDVANASKAKTLLCVSCMKKSPKTRFSEKKTQSKTLDTTFVVSKSKIDVESASKAKDKWFESQPNVIWTPVSAKPNVHNTRSFEKPLVSVKKWVVKLPNSLCAISSWVEGSSDRSVGLGHNLFSVGQFCNGDLEVAFCSNTCYVRNLEGYDLLTGGRDSNLYTISISDMTASSPVCLMSKATSIKSWLWHRRLSHLNFGTINDLIRLDLVDGLPKFKYGKEHLCFACERGKSKKASHPPKLVPSDHSKLELLHMDLCGPIRVASINGKRYILVIVDDYSRYTWVYFVRLKDETTEIIKKFIAKAQLNYKAKVYKIRTDNGTEFKKTTLKAHYEKLGIMQQFSISHTPQQNGVVERRNRTLVKAARTMLIFYRNDRDDLGKMKPKSDIGVFIGYSKTSTSGRRPQSMKLMYLESHHLDKLFKRNKFHQLQEIKSKMMILIFRLTLMLQTMMKFQQSKYHKTLGKKCRDEHQYHIDQMKNFLKSDIVWESRKEILVSPYPRKTTPLAHSCQKDPEALALSLINQDLLYLKKGNSRTEKIVLSLHKFPAIIFNDDDIEE